MARMELSGLDKVLKNLNKEIKAIEGRTLKGLRRAVIIVRRDMEKTAPKIPVDTGNLRASFFTVSTRGEASNGSPGFVGNDVGELQASHSQALSEGKADMMAFRSKGPAIQLGFSAYYAHKVHEDYESKFHRPGSGPGFLAASLKRNKDEILRVIREEAKIK